MGLAVAPGKGVAEVIGKGKVEAVRVAAVDGRARYSTRSAATAWRMFGRLVAGRCICGPRPAAKLIWDEADAMFVPDPDRPPPGADGQGDAALRGGAPPRERRPLTHAGALEGGWPRGCARRARPATSRSAARLRRPRRRRRPRSFPVWGIMPRGAGPEKRAKMWLDYQNDVKVSDVQLAQAGGLRDASSTPSATPRSGMATDQGKIKQYQRFGGAFRSARESPFPRSAPPPFRPPFTPLTLGAIAGEARGDLFQPVRRTPIHDWHERTVRIGSGGPLAPPLRLPATRRERGRRGRPRDRQHPHQRGASRCFDLGQDPREGA